MNFEQALKAVLKHEGGYVNNPNDPGGETNYGVTVAVAREYGYRGPMRDIPMDVVERIYRTQYWDRVRADELPPDVRFHVFDAAVNSGVGRAIRWLQRVVGTTQDGIIGPRTLAAAQAMPSHKLALAYSGTRLRFMTDLQTWQHFGRGWARRIADNLLEA